MKVPQPVVSSSEKKNNGIKNTVATGEGTPARGLLQRLGTRCEEVAHLGFSLGFRLGFRLGFCPSALGFRLGFNLEILTGCGVVV